MASNFFCFLELFGLLRRTVLGGFYCSISLGVVSCVPFPSLVRLSSSSLIYLYLFWSSWVPSGHCLSLLSHFFSRNFAFLSFIRLPYICPIMRTSSRPSHPSGLRIGGSPTKGSNLGQIGGGSDRLAIVVNRVPLVGPPSPYGKGKGKVSEIRYPSDSAYLRAAMQNAKAVGPSRVEPSFRHNFASRYESPLRCSGLVS